MRDLTGERFGRWTVVGFSRVVKLSPTNYRYYWNCVCDCGTKKEVLQNGLTQGASRSCGCLCKEKHPKKHGMSNTRLFWIWHAMNERCYNPNNESYKHYGARGITVCDEWRDSNNFFDWALSNNYSEELTIDRIDFDGNYEPDNCRWVDSYVQANNTRRNHFLTIGGETKTVAQWARQNGISYKLVYQRVRVCGWSFEDAVTKPKRELKKNG